MLTFLFWNIRNQPIEWLVASLVYERQVDVLVIAECEDVTPLVDELNGRGLPPFTHHKSFATRVEVFSRFADQDIRPLGDYEGLTFRELKLPGADNILLVGAHLPSKLWWSDEDQAIQCVLWAREINTYEARLGHRRTIVLGDLNMNPFESGMVTAQGFHATSSRRVVEKLKRRLAGETYSFFYNPMWNHFGDRGPTPPGTYYLEGSRPKNYYWYMLDQVLIRPDLLNFFPEDSLDIVTSVRGVSLLVDDGVPDKARASDHLPVLFSLSLLEEEYE